MTEKKIGKRSDIASCLCAKNGQRAVIHDPRAWGVGLLCCVCVGVYACVDNGVCVCKVSIVFICVGVALVKMVWCM